MGEKECKLLSQTFRLHKCYHIIILFHDGFIIFHLFKRHPFIDHSPAGARSNADAVGILKIVEGQFSDLKIEVLDVFGEEDMVATRILYQGIHAGTCMGIPATGKHISFEALENFRVVDGKIVESWGYWPDKEIEAKLR